MSGRKSYFVVYADGSTNFPGPPARSDKLWTEELLNLKIGTYEINDGLVEYDGHRIPLHLKGEHLRARMSYEAQTPSYRGDVSTDSVQVTAEGYGPIPTSMSATFAIEGSRIVLPRVHVATKESSADLSGTLDDPRTLRGTFAMKGNVAVREAVRIFGLPIEPTGSASFDGQVNVAFDQPLTSILQGRVIARGLGYTQDRLKIRDAEARGELELTRDRLTLRADDRNGIRSKHRRPGGSGARPAISRGRNHRRPGSAPGRGYTHGSSRGMERHDGGNLLRGC